MCVYEETELKGNIKQSIPKRPVYMHSLEVSHSHDHRWLPQLSAGLPSADPSLSSIHPNPSPTFTFIHRPHPVVTRTGLEVHSTSPRPPTCLEPILNLSAMLPRKFASRLQIVRTGNFGLCHEAFFLGRVPIFRCFPFEGLSCLFLASYHHRV